MMAVLCMFLFAVLAGWLLGGVKHWRSKLVDPTEIPAEPALIVVLVLGALCLTWAIVQSRKAPVPKELA